MAAAHGLTPADFWPMTAHQLSVYVNGAARRDVTLAWYTARFAMEGLGKRGLRALNQVLPIWLQQRGVDDDGAAGYDGEVMTRKLRARIAAHNAKWAADHGG